MANKEEIRVYFCPKCKSTNIRYVFGLSNLFGVIPKQKCMGCGLEANAFPILVTNKTALEEDLNKRNKKKKKRVKRK